MIFLDTYTRSKASKELGAGGESELKVLESGTGMRRTERTEEQKRLIYGDHLAGEENKEKDKGKKSSVLNRVYTDDVDEEVVEAETERKSSRSSSIKRKKSSSAGGERKSKSGDSEARDKDRDRKSGSSSSKKSKGKDSKVAIDLDGLAGAKEEKKNKKASSSSKK